MAQQLTDLELVEVCARLVGRRKLLCRTEEGAKRYREFLRRVGDAVGMLEPVAVTSVADPDVSLRDPQQRTGESECDLGSLSHLVGFDPLPGIDPRTTVFRAYAPNRWDLVQRECDGAVFIRIVDRWYSGHRHLDDSEVIGSQVGDLRIMSPFEQREWALDGSQGSALARGAELRETGQAVLGVLAEETALGSVDEGIIHVGRYLPLAVARVQVLVSTCRHYPSRLSGRTESTRPAAAR